MRMGRKRHTAEQIIAKLREAEVGSETFGICSNPFLDEEFKTVRYELEVTIHDGGSFSYAEDTQLRMKGRADLFHHTDGNTLHRV